MDVRHFTHFLAVVEAKSVGRAAAKLNLTQPALSKSIRRLEEMLQVKLFDRGAEGMAATVFGEALAERARFVALEMRHAAEEIQALRGALSGTVAVGGGPSLVGSILGQATASLVAKRPELRVTVVEGFMGPLMRMLREAELDFILGTAADGEVSPDLLGETLFHDEVSAVVRTGHPLLAQKRLSLKLLRRFPWVATREQDPLRGFVQTMYAGAGLEAPEPQITSNSAACMKSVLATSDFVGFLPRLLIEAEERSGALVALRLPAATWRREVQIFRRKRNTLAPAGRALIAELREVCRARMK